MKNIVEETILGPVEGNIGLNKKNLAVNVFPKEAKLNSAFVSEDTVYLDFNKELLLNVTKNAAERAAKNEKKIEENSSEKNICKFSLNYLILYSIIDSVNLNCRELTKFHISFDGVSYKYIDDFGPTDGELYADYKVLVR
ncbi:MAG: GerMN domain-containing protein [Spirochaetales bacterium]|nr:GerMN domain-containing protein [Spirochaetales bacterium]